MNCCGKFWSQTKPVFICQYMPIHRIAVYGNRESTRNSTSTLHAANATVWCGFTASFIIGPYFFEETGTFDPVTVTGQCYECFLRNHVILDFQQLWLCGWDHFYTTWCSSAHCKFSDAAAEGHFGNAREFSAIVSLQSECSELLILKRGNSCCGAI
ncbi:hypothetical protein TNCV_4618531 [Trichonephila clavipes]|nr:hypothetical protein TNCV_4618531 [Trichonephila clavipes]